MNEEFEPTLCWRIVWIRIFGILGWEDLPTPDSEEGRTLCWRIVWIGIFGILGWEDLRTPCPSDAGRNLWWGG
ncbi:MAG: hypothetical protein K1X92_14100 [Bacteroidia bacterium]|nr:hypothetical protein [Bacteroidia bacterium]